MTDAWYAGLPDATARVRCGAETHVLRWRAGRLQALAHPLADLASERALSALGGEPHRCLELLDAWERHAADPRVLLLGPRAQDSRLAIEHRQMAQAWQRPSAPAAGPSATADERIRALLDLDGPLPHRFVASVAAALAGRGGDPDLGPTLQAALYGRVLASLNRWTEATPDLELLMDDVARRVVRRPDGSLLAELPFSWITAVWAHRLDVVDGEFTLAARRDGSGAVELLTVDHALASHTRTLAPR